MKLVLALMFLSVATALATDAPTPAESTVVQGSPTTPTLVPCDIECPEEDGYFEVEPCSPLFCNCADGIGYEQECDDGLVFNPEHMVCSFPEDNPDCEVRV